MIYGIIFLRIGLNRVFPSLPALGIHTNRYAVKYMIGPMDAYEDSLYAERVHYSFSQHHG